METQLLKPAEVADILRISRAMAYSMLKRGEIPTVRIGSTVRVRRSDLEQFIHENEEAKSEPSASEG
jgi:putative molybdopterin biosynthesis protein